MTDNPFLAGAELSAPQRAPSLAPGQRVRVRYYTLGLGLGGGRYDHDVTGQYVGDDGFNYVVCEDNGGVMNYAPKFWIDEMEVL